MFSKCLCQTKPLPDFSGTDTYQVSVKLNGTVQDPAFIRFFEKVSSSVGESFYVEDLLVLDFLRQGKRVPKNLEPRLDRLTEKGVIELVSRGRGARYLLSKKFYDFSNTRGAYTRTRGLNRETNKALILEHLRHHKRGVIKEFEEVLPSLTRNQIHSLLKELKAEGKAVHSGGKKLGFWELATS
jgi:ATP-dependent DNA helicase RecG